jgi:hypothetical protein
MHTIRQQQNELVVTYVINYSTASELRTQFCRQKNTKMRMSEDSSFHANKDNCGLLGYDTA